MRNRLRPSAVMAAAALSAVAGRSVSASVFGSPSDLVILQTNGDGSGGGDSVTLLDMSVTGAGTASAASANASSNTGAGITLTAAGTVNLPTDTLSYNGTPGLGLVLPDGSSVVGNSHGGQITLSQDGHSLTLGTYLAPVGTVNYYGTPYSPNGVTPEIAPRVITVVGPTGGLTEAATLTGPDDYNSVDIRQVTSLNGTQFWSTGNGAKPYGSGTADLGGLRFSTTGAASTTSLNPAGGVDIRTTTIYQGQLYGDSGSNNSPPGEHTLSQLGTGIQSTSAPAWTPLPAVGGGYTNGTILGNQSPSFVTLDDGVSVVYESDSTTGGLEKWTLTNGNWAFSGRVVFGSDAIENVVARVNPDGSVSLYGDNNSGSNGVGQIYGFTDTGGAGQMNLIGLTDTPDSNGNHIYLAGNPIYNGSSSAGVDTQQFWGLSFAPSTSKALENQIWGNLNSTTGAGGGSWNNSTNWAGTAIPDASGSTATFGPGLTATGTVTLDGTQTVGHVVFNDAAANYTLTPGTGGTLVIDNTDPNSNGVPSIFNSAGNQTIAVPVSLANGVTIADHFQASLLISKPITGTGEVDIYGPGALTLSAASTYSGATVVHSGSLVIPGGGSLPTTTALTVGDTTDTAATGLTAAVTFNASTGTTVRSITLGSLSVVSNGSVVIAQPATVTSRSVLVLSTLSFTGTTGNWTGQLDLTGNDMVVNSGNLAQITSQVRQGYNLTGGGNWQGSGGITSSTAAANTTHLTALGVIQNNQDGPVDYTASKPFDGLTPASSAVLVKYTYVGDANLDGKVDGSDYSLIDAGYASKGTLTGWYNGDFNYDGVIDGSDYALIDNAYNNQGAALSSAALTATATAQTAPAKTFTAVTPTAVPEPAGLAALIAAAATLTTARSSRRTRPA